MLESVVRGGLLVLLRIVVVMGVISGGFARTVDSGAFERRSVRRFCFFWGSAMQHVLFFELSPLLEIVQYVFLQRKKIVLCLLVLLLINLVFIYKMEGV